MSCSDSSITGINPASNNTALRNCPKFTDRDHDGIIEEKGWRTLWQDEGYIAEADIDGDGRIVAAEIKYYMHCVLPKPDCNVKQNNPLNGRDRRILTELFTKKLDKIESQHTAGDKANQLHNICINMAKAGLFELAIQTAKTADSSTRANIFIALIKIIDETPMEKMTATAHSLLHSIFQEAFDIDDPLQEATVRYGVAQSMAVIYNGFDRSFNRNLGLVERFFIGAIDATHDAPASKEKARLLNSMIFSINQWNEPPSGPSRVAIWEILAEIDINYQYDDLAFSDTYKAKANRELAPDSYSEVFTLALTAIKQIKDSSLAAKSLEIIIASLSLPEYSYLAPQLLPAIIEITNTLSSSNSKAHVRHIITLTFASLDKNKE